MERDAMQALLKWKESPRRKPLVMEGARQVGKTWLVKEFGRRHYKTVAYINFEEMVFLRNLFEQDYDTDRIVTAINAATHQVCCEGETLIFLDEIQEARGGLTALKYFQENAPGLHVIVAGSLLGIELHRATSFPVGKVQFLTLHPMTYKEFLRAMGEAPLTRMLDDKDWASITLFKTRFELLLKQYYYVGGMPEAVQSFSERKDWDEVRDIQNEILQSYARDFSKHAPQDIVPRLRLLWQSMPRQLSRENRKFVYGLVRKGARAREYETALQWLFDSGLVHKVCAVTAPRLPLRSYEDMQAFKLFTIDVGLLGAMAGLDAMTVLKGNDIYTEFKGALTEQYALQQMLTSKQLFYYSKPNSRQEIDFLYQDSSEVIPVEVKAETNVKAKSLRTFVEENHTTTAYRLSLNDYRQEEWLTNVPLYAIATL